MEEALGSLGIALCTAMPVDDDGLFHHVMREEEREDP